MRTETVLVTYMLTAVLLAGSCSRERAGETENPVERRGTVLSIAEVNYTVSDGGAKSADAGRDGVPTGPAAGDGASTGAAAGDGVPTGPAAGDGAPQTRAIVDGGGHTFFTDRDRLGLFLRGDGYEDVDNRIVQLDYPGEGPQKKWKITGEAIPLYADAATVTAYFPYSDAYGLMMSAVPLNSGPYDVNTNDVVWQRDTVHSTHTQAMFLEMQHAMTRVKIRLNRGTSDTSDSSDYTGEGKITGVRIADAGDVAADDRVVYLDGTLDLTQATPVVTPGWPDAVADKSEKTLTAEGVLYDLLLLPVDKIDEGKVMLNVVIDDKLLSAPFPVDAVDKWEAGKAYTYEVAVRNGAAQVVFGKATVTPWNDGGSISGDLDTSKPEYGGGDVQDWGDNEWGAEEGGDEPVTGEIADASLVPPPADNVIPAEGGEYSVRLTGNWTGSVSVRMSVGGNIGGLLHAACSNGAATVAFTVPANASGSLRTVAFEYLWNGTWTKIGADCTQAEYYVITDKTVTPEGDIPGLGGTYSVKLTGILPVAGVEVRANISGAAPVTGTVIASGTPVELSIPANRTGAARTVIFEYNWNSEWTMIGNECSQVNTRIGELYGGGVIYWVNPEDDNDFRVVALDMSADMTWAPSTSYVLGAGARDPNKRNGADVWKIAKQYSDDKNNGASGSFATDFPAFSYCYEKTDGNVPQGTWYLPSLQEVNDLWDARYALKDISSQSNYIPWTTQDLRTATESTDWPNTAYVRTGWGVWECGKNKLVKVKCVRQP